MAYTKQTWTAPTGTGLSRYAKSGETDTHIELALDPVNLTNAPTPITVARLNHMEEGIAKAYDTAPPTPWAQYSGKDIPQLPDNLAGVTYKSNFSAGVDGWAPYQSTLNSVNNALVISLTASGGTGQKGVTVPAGKQFVVIAKSSKAGNIKLMGTVGGVANTPIKTVPCTAEEYVIIPVYLSLNLTWFVILASGANDIAGTNITVSQVYIGTGAYDRLVFDNSYHYRHLLNNAVVPTPQGLYFNGKTSYLRSKEKITLPDVFTFRATVNCAIKSAGQFFISLDTGVFSLYINPNSANLILAYYNTNTSATAYQTVFHSLYTENTDFDLELSCDFINKTIKLAKNGVMQNTITLPYLQKPTAQTNIFIGNDAYGSSPFLGYMRNIQFYDTALTDTQRNWLAQGNTPPILYDVTNYELEGYVSIQDADGTNTGVETDVDSNGNRILKLPATIKANVTGTASKANVRVSLRHGNTWFDKTWTGLTEFIGPYIWTDGENIYYSGSTQQYVLNKATSTWVVKTWTGLTDFNGNRIWTDGDNIYHSNGTTQYVLNKATSTWTAKTWTGLINFYGYDVWTDGENIYYSGSTQQYVLNKATSTWVVKTWTGLTIFNGSDVWTDGENIYYSGSTQQFALNKATSTWVAKTWTGHTAFNGERIWTDGENIYHSQGTNQFALNKATSTWTAKTWTDLTSFLGINIWTDGYNIYYSDGTTQHVLPATRHNYIDDDKYNSLFGTVTTCNCSTLSDRFVFRNE